MSNATCAAEDCTLPRYGRKDYCRKHQARIDRNGTLAKKKSGPAPAAPKVCMVPDCGKPHKGYGYCAPHLRAERLAGRLMDNIDACGFTGCGRPVHGNGLCMEHSRQMRKRGVLTPIREYTRQGAVCSVDGCEEPTQSKDLCTGHYARLLEGREIDTPLRRYRPKGGPCSVGECDHEADVEGMCQTHRRRFLAGAEPGWDAPIPARAPNGAGHIEPKTGYVHITVNGRQVREHRHVVAELLGRPLLPTETVHHVNGVRHDNTTDGPLVMDERGRMRSGNLELWSHSQPAGQEIGPKVEWARQLLATYGSADERAAYAGLTLPGAERVEEDS